MLEIFALERWSIISQCLPFLFRMETHRSPATWWTYIRLQTFSSNTFTLTWILIIEGKNYPIKKLLGKHKKILLSNLLLQKALSNLWNQLQRIKISQKFEIWKEKMDFYYLPGSAPCRAVQMTAKAVGAELNLKFMNLMAGEHLKPEFIKINPQHSVPTLVDNGFSLVGISSYHGLLGWEVW